MTSLEEKSLAIFCYLSASNIRPDKRSGLSWEWPYIRGRLLYVFSNRSIFYFIVTLHDTSTKLIEYIIKVPLHIGDRHGRDRMVVGFTTSYAISAYHHLRCEFESRSGGMYSVQFYVMKFVSDMQQVSGFLRVLRFPPPIKLTTPI